MKPRAKIGIAIGILAIVAIAFVHRRASVYAAAYRNQPDRALCQAYWYNRALSWYHRTDVCDPMNWERFRVMTDF